MSDRAVDFDIPADVLGQLTDIIDESNAAADAANGSFAAEDDAGEDEAGQRDQVSADADEDQRDAAGKGQAAASETDDADDDEDTAALSAEADELEGATFDDDSGDEADEVTQLRTQVQELSAWRDNMLLQAREAEEKQIREQTEAQAKAEYDRFMAEIEDLAETDPVAAEKKKTALVLNYASNLLLEKQQAVMAAEETKQRQAAVDFIKNGGRAMPDGKGGYTMVPNAAKPLRDDEVELLNLLDHPTKMQTFADKAIERRTAQTARARQVLAQKRRAAGEGQVTGAGGRTASPPEAKDPTNLDEWWALQTETYGGTPEALLQQSMGLQRHR